MHLARLVNVRYWRKADIERTRLALMLLTQSGHSEELPHRVVGIEPVRLSLRRSMCLVYQTVGYRYRFTAIRVP